MTGQTISSYYSKGLNEDNESLVWFYGELSDFNKWSFLRVFSRKLFITMVYAHYFSQ